VSQGALANCFATALAKQKKADLFTGEPDFREVERYVNDLWFECSN